MSTKSFICQIDDRWIDTTWKEKRVGVRTPIQRIGMSTNEKLVTCYIRHKLENVLGEDESVKEGSK